MSPGWIEVVGYMGSAIVVLSLTMNSLSRLRILSLFGSIVFLVYGWLIDAPPLLVVNFTILLVNAYKLIQMFAKKDYFAFQEVRPESRFLQEFIRHYADEIDALFPRFQNQFDDKCYVLLTLRNMSVSGLFVGRKEDDTTFRILLDYAIPQHADSRVGRHVIHENGALFRDLGYDIFKVNLDETNNGRYFQKLGFLDLGNGELQLPIQSGV